MLREANFLLESFLVLMSGPHASEDAEKLTRGKDEAITAEMKAQIASVDSSPFIIIL